MGKVYETALKIGATISKTFRSDTLSAAGALTKLTGAAKQLAQAEKAAASYKKLGAAVASSKSNYSQAAEALRRLEAAERAAGGATKESTQWRKVGERELAKYAKEMDRATKAAAVNSTAMRNLPGLRLAASKERLFGAGKADTTPLFSKAGAQMRSIASDVMFLGTAAGTAGAAMAGLVMHSLAAGDEIGDTADKLGIATTALQELRYGAEQSGAEAGALDKALGKMSVTIGKFKNAKGKGGGAGGMEIPGLQMLGTGGGEGGGGSESNPLKQIGLSAKALAGMKPDQQLLKIADGMTKLKTHSDKAAVAQAIFGKGAKEILPFLEEGSAGIKKLQEQAHKYGGIMSPEALKNADEADKALKQAKLALFGVSNTLGAELLPMATRVFGEFSQFVGNNRGEIKKWAEDTAKWIETKAWPAVLKIGGEIKSAAAKVLTLVEAGAKLTGGFGNLAIAVGALRMAPLIGTLGKISIEGFKAADALFKYRDSVEAAGGADGTKISGAGKAIGVAATAQIMIGAAAVGYAIGTALDDKFGISDWLAGKRNKETPSGQIVDDSHTGGMASYAVYAANQKIKANQARLGVAKADYEQKVQQYMAGGLSKGQAIYAAEHPGSVTSRPNTNGGGVVLQFSPKVDITPGAADETVRQLSLVNEQFERQVKAILDRQQREARRTGDGP